MAKFWSEVGGDWRQAPMAYWVPEEPPAPVMGGYRWYFVKSQGFTFQFSSIPQIEHCREILGQKLLPTSQALSELVCPEAGPNRHWLSRLPPDLKKWSIRQRIVQDLERALKAFAKS